MLACCCAWRSSAGMVAHPAGSIPHPLLPGFPHLHSPAVHSSWVKKTPWQRLACGIGMVTEQPADAEGTLSGIIVQAAPELQLRSVAAGESAPQQ